MKAPPFWIGQRVRFTDSAFKENTGVIIAYHPREPFPWAVEIKHKDTDGEFVYEQYGFRSCEMVAAQRRQREPVVTLKQLRLPFDGGAA